MDLELVLIAQPGSLREETQRRASLQARRTRSRRLKQSWLHQAFSGEL